MAACRGCKAECESECESEDEGEIIVELEQYSLSNLPDFQLKEVAFYSDLFRSKGIYTFHQACTHIAALPYGRNSQREDFSLVLTEGRGSCSSKHALLAALAEENAREDIELIAGIFLMSDATHRQLTGFFDDKPYNVIPECHCYLRYKRERFDFTDTSDAMSRIAPKIVREQRIEPHQVVDWKPKIHQEYIKSWLQRNPHIDRDLETIWKEREECIARL